MLTVPLVGGQSVVIHSNPADAGGNPVVPPSNVQWAQDTNQFGTGAPQGIENEDYKFSAPAGGPVGVTNLLFTLSQGGLPTVTGNVQITVGPGLITQFIPTADAPTTP